MMSQEPVMTNDLEETQYQELAERTRQLELQIRLIEARVQALENSIPDDQK